jgi:hypothetical protein
MSQINDLMRHLESSDPAEQATAAEALAQLGEDARPAIASLVRHVGSGEEAVAQWCNSALEDVGAPLDEQIGDLTAMAKAADPNVAYWAVTLLGRAGAAARGAVAVLQDRAGDASAPHVQKRARWALDQISG